MKYCAILLLLSLSACARQPQPQSPTPEQMLWQEAHAALYQNRYESADSLFVILAEAHPDTPPGREALYYAAVARIASGRSPAALDRAADALTRYLNQPVPRGGNWIAAQSLLDLVKETRQLHRRSQAAAKQAATLGTQIDSLSSRLQVETQALQNAQAELERIRRTLVGRSE